MFLPFYSNHILVALETWTKLADQVVHVGEKKLKKQKENGLDKWLNREQTYQEVLMTFINKRYPF